MRKRRAPDAKRKARHAAPRRREPTKTELVARAEVLERSLTRERSRRQQVEQALDAGLQQQAATSEILRVISSSPTDVQPVFDTIAKSAGRLLGAWSVGVFRYDGCLLHPVAAAGANPASEQTFMRVQPHPPVGPEQCLFDGAPVQIPDVEADPAAPEPLRRFARARGWRSNVHVPIRRDTEPVGIISVSRAEPGGFSPAEVELLQTFADQAVIAIENVRLFTELQEKNRALTDAHAQVTEALEGQTATAEILRVIASTPTDVAPVLDAIVENAARLCNAQNVGLFRIEGDVLRHVADKGSVRVLTTIGATMPPEVWRATALGWAVSEKRTVHLHDVQAEAAETHPDVQARNVAAGVRSLLVVPLVCEDGPIGVIAIRRTEVAPFTAKQIDLMETFADQAVIAIENVRLFTELRARNRDLTEALAQQTATGEILRVISRVPADVSAVFQTICRSAVRLFDAQSGGIVRVEGTLLHLAAVESANPDTDQLRRAFPRPPDRNLIAGRAILDATVVQIPDAEDDASELQQAVARQFGFRRAIAVPMLREGRAIGAITVSGREPGQYSEQQVELLRNFADQAVIAIENVRLFTELQERNHEVTEALERQTATSEILRVISSSPTDVQPVFNVIADRAWRLFGAWSVAVFRLDGDLLRLAAARGGPVGSEHIIDAYPVTRDLPIGRCVLDRTVIHVADVEADTPDAEVFRETARARGWRAALQAPMARDNQAIGVISVTRAEAGPFSSGQVDLLTTFADQAVIAIENVRLFTELQQKNRALTEALEQQTATADILRVISRSHTDVGPVFQAIVDSAKRLLHGNAGVISRIVDDRIELAAYTHTDGAGDALLESFFPIPLQPDERDARPIRERVIGERVPYNVADVETDPRVGERGRANARARGYRSQLVVPMLRNDEVVGTIAVTRAEPGAFADDEIALLQTFADQAVIAIENARLLTELQARNHDLTESLDRQTATAEILQVISRSQADVQPVFDTIAQNAQRLFDARTAGVYTFDGERLHIGASIGVAGPRRDFVPMCPSPILTVGRCALARSVIHVADVQFDPEASEASREVGRTQGWRSGLAVPMLRDDQLIGVIFVSRVEAGAFEPVEIELLKTFADQAVIAIENARLLSELQARTQELTRSVEQLTALGEVGQAVSSTLDLQTVLRTIVARATLLAGVDAGIIYEYDGVREVFEPRATEHLEEEIVELLATAPIRKNEGATGRVAETREPVQLTDITMTPIRSHARDVFLRAGYRSLLAVPLMREDDLIGALTVIRRTPGEFSQDIVDLLRTFAAQSSLAIQNARLFHELEIKRRELEIASQHKSEFLASMSHELRTPLNAIIGFSDVLLERMFGELNDKQTEYLQDILASGKHLLSLINDILDLSKIEAGRMELDLAEFDLPQAIDDALLLMRERASRRGIAVERAVDERLGPAHADERKVKQVLLNLLSNAVKFTPEGGRIDVRAGLSGDMAEISVADTGIGIAPDDHDAVFEEFRQVGSSARKVEGTGLGLALCRKFVELHGGRIWVKSQVGQGSTFTFTIPVRRDG